MHGDRHVWEFQWVRDLAVAGLLVGLVWLAYSLRAVTLPVLLGLALAYVVNPVVGHASDRWRVPRWASTLAILVSAIAILGGLLVYLLPKLVMQVVRLIQSVPTYLRELAGVMGVNWRGLVERVEERLASALPAVAGAEPASPATEPATAPADPGRLPSVELAEVGGLLMNALTASRAIVGSAIQLGSYVALFCLILVFSFFFFSWKFERILAWFASFIPNQRRARALALASRMDRAVSSFLRGRLIQGALLGAALSLGWWLCGVPYWLVLGMGSGFLNLIPFVAVAMWPVAVVLTWTDQLSAGAALDPVHVLVLPSLVYIVCQGLDAWVLEPLVQGQATNLDPLSVLLAVIAGGALGGLLGMLVAIPVAACLKILSQEELLPRFRRYMQANE